MPALVNIDGDDDGICPGGPLYSNLMDTSLFVSLVPHADVYCPPLKRTRVSAPFFFHGGDKAANQSEQVCSIDTLPDECLFEILRRLPGKQERSVSACVSKRWLMLLSCIRSSKISTSDCKVDESSKLSKKPLPDLNGNGDEDEVPETENNDGYLSRCLEGKEATDMRLVAVAVGTGSCGGLGKLLIRDSNTIQGVTDVGLSAIARGCPFLRVLSMCNVPFITDEGLSEIVNRCPLLEKLDLCKCPLISDKGIIAVAMKCPNLSSLVIESCSKIGNEGLQAIGRCCPHLQSISIMDSVLVGDQGVANLVSSASSSLVKIKLQNLNITDVSLAVIGHYGRAVTDLVFAGLQNVGEKGFWVMGNACGLQKLKSFTVTSCRLTDLGLEAVAKGCPILGQMCLQRCCYLSDAGLKVFAATAGSLESLQLEECNRITLIGIVSALLNCNAKFKAIALKKCMGIKDINSCSAPLRSCLSLRSLSICHCRGFGSSSLAMVAKLCPQLQLMDLSGLLGVTDAGLLPLIEGCRSGLVKVNLSGCINLTDAVVSALARLHGVTLQMLNLDGCRKVTDESLLALAGCCSLLEDLDVSRCAITDYGVAALASARQLNIRFLSLSDCSKVSTRSLPLLGNLGRSLVALNLQRCNLISTSAIGVLEEKLLWCNILS